MNIPLVSYDFFGYLIAGFLVIIGVDALDGSMDWIVGKELKLTTAAFLAFLAHVTGQAVSSLAKSSLEYGLVARLLKRPSVRLLTPLAGWRRVFAALEYFRPLDAGTISRIETKARELGWDGTSGETLFLLAYSHTRAHDKLHEKLAAFRDKYGMNRNVAFVALAWLITALVFRFVRGAAIPGDWLVVGALVAAICLVRYLKFFRQYSYELLTVFSRRESHNQNT